MDEQIKRIREMEARLNRITFRLHNGTGDIREDLRLLEEYYRSPLWLSDFEADEAGKLPADLLRGVLSEDAVYNVLETAGEQIGRNGKPACKDRDDDAEERPAELKAGPGTNQEGNVG